VRFASLKLTAILLKVKQTGRFKANLDFRAYFSSLKFCRLLEINNELRSVHNLTIESSLAPSVGNDSIAAELSYCEESFQIDTENLPDRTGPEGEEYQVCQFHKRKKPTEIKEEEPIDQAWPSKKSLDEKDKPRYTLYELEEVLNEKNKYKGTLSFIEIDRRPIQKGASCWKRNCAT
jgi:hypothetical protein